MYLFIVVLHILVAMIMILFILLQPGKGADPGSAFGGGLSSTMFGPRGPTNALQHITTGAAVIFMVTSVTLAMYSNRSTMGGTDLEDELERLRQKQEQVDQPASPATPPTTPAAPATGTEPSPVLIAPPEGSTAPLTPPADPPAPGTGDGAEGGE